MLNHHFPNETLLKNWSRPHSWTHPEYHISGDIPIISHYIPRKTSQPKIINLPILRADLPLAQTWVMSLFRWAAFESRGPKGWEILRIQSRMTNNMTKNMSIQIKQASWRFFFHGKKKKQFLGMGQWVLILALPSWGLTGRGAFAVLRGLDGPMANAISMQAWFQCLQTWNHGSRFPDDLNPTTKKWKHILFAYGHSMFSDQHQEV